MFAESLKGKKIVIYGTGHVARKFYRAMADHGMHGQVQYFVRTRDVEDGELFEGLHVRRFDEACPEDDILVCLAVHESLRDEIEQTVRKKTGNYIWIYPYLYELMLGEPEKKNVALRVRTLFGGFRDDLRLGIRLAAIEQQEGINDFGFDYYVRAQMLHCSRDTAQHRLRQFQNLITEWNRTGYHNDSLLTVNRNYGVIDGNHRLAMAVYTGLETIYGDVYPTDLSVEDIHGREPMLSKGFLLQHGFSRDETERAEEIQKRYLTAYEGK